MEQQRLIDYNVFLQKKIDQYTDFITKESVIHPNSGSIITSRDVASYYTNVIEENKGRLQQISVEETTSLVDIKYSNYK